MAEESNLQGDGKPSRASALAGAVLRLLEAHPVIKLAVVLWVGGVSIWAPIDAWRRGQAEAWRGGWAAEPSVDLGTTAEACVLINTGSRPISEVTLRWNVFRIDYDACEVTASVLGSETAPDAATRELLPRDRVTAEFLGSVAQKNCSSLLCPTVQQCGVVVECRATYHRAADLEPFDRSRFAFAEPSCGQLAGIATLASLGPAGPRWKDPKRQRMWSCFLDFRRSVFPKQQQAIEGLMGRDERVNSTR